MDGEILKSILKVKVKMNSLFFSDTHMRQIRIHSPIEPKKNPALDKFNEFSTVEFQQFATIR